jgi:hypothetical protein
MFIEKGAGDTFEIPHAPLARDDVYFCPALLSQRRRQKPDVLESAVLWVDFDYPVEVSHLNPQPSVVVQSSEEHYHCYWRLQQPVQLAQLEEYNQRLALYAQGDLSGWDAIQLLRLPAGVNSKRRDQDLWEPKLLYVQDTAYTLDDFSHLPELSEQQLGEGQVMVSGEFPDLDFDIEEVRLRLGAKVTPRLLGLINHGAGKSKRSEALYKVYAECERLGINQDDAFRLIYNAPCDKWVDARSRHAKELWQDLRRAYSDIRAKMAPAQATDDISQRLQALRKAKGETQADKTWDIGTAIVENMEQRGLFVRTLQPEGHYFLESRTGKLYTIDEKNRTYQGLLVDWYKCYPSMDEFKNVTVHAYMRASNVEATEVHRLTYYDQLGHRLYVNSFDHHFYRLDGKDITRHKNGTDGVVFATDDLSIPFKYEPSSGNLLHELVFGVSKYDPSHGLTAAEYSHLLRTWVLAMMFKGASDTRPLMLVTGPRGSGKSSLLRGIMRMLYGKHADVQTTPREPKELGRVIASRELVGFDNAEEKPENGMFDMLAIASTGGKYVESKMYANGEVVTYDLRSFVGISAMSPDVVSRPDLAQRTLTLPLLELGQDVVEEVEMQRVLSVNRNKLWGEWLDYLNRVLLYVKQHGWARPQGTKIRMADFARILETTCAVDGRSAEGYLKHLSEAQQQAAIESDPVVLAFVELFEMDDAKLGVPMNAKYWFNTLKRFPGFEAKVSAVQQLGRALDNSISMFATAGYKWTKGRNQQGVTYQFDRITPS